VIEDHRSIAIVGVGNTLMQDDGVGVWAVRTLTEQYVFPSTVQLIEGGVLGLQLLYELRRVQQLLIIDAMNGGGTPGTVYWLDAERLPKDRGVSMSLHEVGLAEVLSVGELLDWRPRVRILGVQPQEVRSPGLKLTPVLQAALPRVVHAAVEELVVMGVEVQARRSRDSQPISMACT
jgi:hydrogenase maturation protease